MIASELEKNYLLLVLLDSDFHSAPGAGSCAFACSTNSSTVRTSASLSDDSVGLLNPSGLDGDSMLEFDGKIFQ